MVGTSAAVTEAARLDEIGFPEFTCKLVTDVFDALISANIRQTEAYIELLKATSKTLTQFINDTKDDISGAMLLQFLTATVPDSNHESGTKVRQGGSLTAQEASSLNAQLEVKEAGISNDNKVADSGSITATKLDSIREAVAKRLAADKYTLLKEMVKQGLLRMVVENGVIETRLTFTTYGSTFYQRQSSSYDRSSFNFRASAGSGGLASLWVKASASTSFTRVGIRTAKESHRDVSGSRVNIFGRVYLNFRTDYLPLPEPQE